MALPAGDPQRRPQFGATSGAKPISIGQRALTPEMCSGLTRTEAAAVDNGLFMKAPPTDAMVIERSLADSECFAEIFDRHVSPIHGYLARRTGSERADALVGEVFRVAFETRHRYDLDRPSALPWLYGISSNVLRQARRTDRRQDRAATKLASFRPVDAAPSDAIDDLLRQERLNEVIDVVMSLPGADRETVLLYAWEELTYEQVAEALDIPLGTVRSRLSRARTRIREQLAASGQEGAEPSERTEWRCRP